MKPSFFVVFEGIDGVGKSTQAQQLYAYLLSNRQLWEHKYKGIVLTQEPGYFGSLFTHKNMGAFDPKTILFLMLADRIEHVKTVIQPALRQGKIVICDRYDWSTIAYQSYGFGIDTHLVETLIGWSNQLSPDLILYLEMDPAIAFNRVVSRGDPIPDLQLLYRVLQGYRYLLYSDSLGPQIAREIPAMQPADAIFNQVKHFITEYLTNGTLTRVEN